MALYIHWPFCLSKCPYCDFNSHVPEGAVNHRRWRNALLTELDHFSSEMTGRGLTSIFFGGGTPSTMEPETAHALIEAAKGFWPSDRLPEVTLEANPTSVEAAKLEDFRAAGINRLSMGIQSFDDEALKFLGRGHSAAEARRAIELAKSLFDRMSFDLIYARPGQTLNSWCEELELALAFKTRHLSLYQLSVENGTAFFRQGVEEAEEDTSADLFVFTRDIMERHEMPAYEISNHASPGEACHHNLFIWRGGDYLGVGPGAHSRLTTQGQTDALYQISSPERWAETVAKKGFATAKRQTLTRRERLDERVMTGLRLAEGIPIELADNLPAESIRELIEAGFLETVDGKLRTTDEGRMRLNGVLQHLLT